MALTIVLNKLQKSLILHERVVIIVFLSSEDVFGPRRILHFPMTKWHSRLSIPRSSCLPHAGITVYYRNSGNGNVKITGAGIDTDSTKVTILCCIKTSAKLIGRMEMWGTTSFRICLCCVKFDTKIFDSSGWQIMSPDQYFLLLSGIKDCLCQP